MMMDNCSLATRLPQLATNPNQNLSTSPMEEDNATTLGLQSLAPELIANVMMFLDFGDVLRSSRVCRKFRDIIEDSLQLRYMKELACCGMIDGASCGGTSLAERYTKLILFDSTWRSLAWRRHEVLRIRGATAIYDLYGGVLATGIPLEENRNRWKLEFRELDSLRKSPRSPSEPLHWSYEVCLPLVEMALDPAQDLLILLTVSDGPMKTLTAHVRTLSGNTPHALSQSASSFQYNPTDPLQNPLDRRLGPWVVVQIFAELVGMLVFADGQEARDSADDYIDITAQLVIWNWTTGRQVACISGLQGPVSFSFLNARFVMITRLGNSASPPPTPEPTSDAESTSSASTIEYLRSRGWHQRPQEHRRVRLAKQQPSLDIFDLEMLGDDEQLDETSYCRRFFLPSVKAGARVQMARLFSEISSTPTPNVPLTAQPFDFFDSPRGVKACSQKLFDAGVPQSKDVHSTLRTRDEARNNDDVPLPTVRSCAPPGLGTVELSPFTLSPMNRVFVIRLVLSKRHRRSVFHNLVGEDLQSPTQEYAFFVPFSTLARGLDTPTKSPCERVVPWDAWGPQGSRLFQLNSSSDFFDMDRSFYPYGPRCVLPLRTEDEMRDNALELDATPTPSSRFRLRVIDVNQLAVRRFMHTRRMQGRRNVNMVSNGSHSTVQAVDRDAPTVVSRMTSFFDEDVVTKLPYLETRTGEGVTFDCDTAMLTEDSLITVKAEDMHYAVQIYTF